MINTSTITFRRNISLHKRQTLLDLRQCINEGKLKLRSSTELLRHSCSLWNSKFWVVLVVTDCTGSDQLCIWSLPHCHQMRTFRQTLHNFATFYKFEGDLACRATTTPAQLEKRELSEQNYLPTNYYIYPPLSNHFIAQNRVQSLQPSQKDFYKKLREILWDNH